jgi:hypothetical protein
MSDKPVAHLTLREKFNAAERLSRELIEHLEQGFIPKAHELMRLVQPLRSGVFPTDVEDLTVRNHVAAVLESENYTEQLCEKLEAHCQAIKAEVSRIVSGT